MHSLDSEGLQVAADRLAARDDRLATLLVSNGYPPLWRQSAGFARLVFIMLGQQVSTSSQAAAYRRLQLSCGRVTPAAVLRLGPARLQAAGLTRQKSRYCIALAEALRSGSLNLNSLQALPDDQVRERLQTVPGIGRWTADVYLFLALLRPDVWPRGDLALDRMVCTLWTLPARANSESISRFAERWQPFRAVAARMLWQEYLARPGRYRRTPRSGEHGPQANRP